MKLSVATRKNILVNPEGKYVRHFDEWYDIFMKSDFISRCTLKELLLLAFASGTQGGVCPENLPNMSESEFESLILHTALNDPNFEVEEFVPIERDDNFKKLVEEHNKKVEELWKNRDHNDFKNMKNYNPEEN